MGVNPHIFPMVFKWFSHWFLGLITVNHLPIYNHVPMFVVWLPYAVMALNSCK